MTTDDRRGSPSEDLVRKAQESLREDPPEIPAPPEPPELSGEMARTEEPAAVPEPRQRHEPASATRPQDRPPEVARPDAPIDYRRGLVFAVLAAAVGAVAWALILAYAEIQSWLLGIGIGYLIGLAAIRGAGKVNRQLLVVAVVLTFLAVIVGEVLGTAMLINKDFGIFDVDLARRLYFDNLGGDFAFALGSAAAGALAVFFATRE